MKHSLLSLLFVFVPIAVFCSGCCSMHVWQETGKVTTHVQAFALLSYAVWGHKGVSGWWE
ncbi:MAG: hypothetical protein J5944_11315 [Lentisphaeria bacterium]|nr:hypothetical protein [Lentisphaeria bacterium]